MKRTVLWEGDTAYGQYQVVDETYDNRPARVLYSGDNRAAQSGVAQDNQPDLLFDYNQRMFELVTNLVPKRLLLIGGAVSTLPTALLAALPDILIDVVEPDAGLTKLAYQYFDLPVDERLRIFHTDGRSFLRGSNGLYDIILIDAFVHTAIPKSLKTVEAFKSVSDHLTHGGFLAMNVISGYHGPTAKTLHQIYAAASASFSQIDVFLASRGFSLWLPQNFVLTAQKIPSLSLQDYIRHEAVQPLQISPDEALHDAD